MYAIFVVLSIAIQLSYFVFDVYCTFQKKLKLEKAGGTILHEYYNIHVV